nr:hypothetical protein [Tanacetum cinerariifolium]
LGFGNQFDGDFLAISGVTVEVLFERLQTAILHADGLTLHFAGTVAALVDQYAKHFAAANGGKVTDLGFLDHDRWSGGACAGVGGDQQQA